MNNNEILSVRIPHKTKKARLIELLGKEGIKLPLKTPHKKVVQTFKKKQEEIKQQIKNLKPEIINIDSDSESEEEVVKEEIIQKNKKNKKESKKTKKTKPIIEEEIESEQEEEKQDVVKKEEVDKEEEKRKRKRKKKKK